VVYRDVTRQAKGLYRLKHVGALWSGLPYLSRYNSGWFCHSVFNKTFGCVEVACDVTFDESNGSQGEQVDDVVGMEESPSKAIKKLATGEIKPQEQEDQDDDDVLMFKGSSTSTSAAQPGNSGNMSGDSGSPVRSIRK
jgi:hypothetical protein